jgi:hypothetical protein
LNSKPFDLRQVTEDIALVARKMSAPAMIADDEEAADPFADVDDAFPQEGWQRQKEDKEDGFIKQVMFLVHMSDIWIRLNCFQALATLDGLVGAKSEDFVQSLHNVLLLQEEVIDKCFLVKCHRVPVIFDAMGHDNTTVRLAALELCMRMLVRFQGGAEIHIRYNQLHVLQVL